MLSTRNEKSTSESACESRASIFCSSAADCACEQAAGCAEVVETEGGSLLPPPPIPHPPTNTPKPNIAYRTKYRQNSRDNPVVKFRLGGAIAFVFNLRNRHCERIYNAIARCVPSVKIPLACARSTIECVHRVAVLCSVNLIERSRARCEKIIERKKYKVFCSSHNHREDFRLPLEISAVGHFVRNPCATSWLQWHCCLLGTARSETRLVRSRDE